MQSSRLPLPTTSSPQSFRPQSPTSSSLSNSNTTGSPSQSRNSRRPESVYSASSLNQSLGPGSYRSGEELAETRKKQGKKDEVRCCFRAVLLVEGVGWWVEARGCALRVKDGSGRRRWISEDGRYRSFIHEVDTPRLTTGDFELLTQACPSRAFHPSKTVHRPLSI